MRPLTLFEIVLGLLAITTGVLLAKGSTPAGRWMLFCTAIVAAGLFFLPGPQITDMAGDIVISPLRRLAAATPWSASEWVHFLLFMWLGFLLCLARADLRGWKAVTLVAVLAVTAEIAQELAPGRSPRLNDVLVNLAGALAGLAVGAAVRKLARFRGTRPAPRKR